MSVLKTVALACVMSLAPATFAGNGWSKAVELYPELGIADSAFSKEFGRMRRQRKSSNPKFFENPQWPVLLAKECAARRNPGQKTEAKPSADTMVSPPPEPIEGEKLYVAKCGRCHDVFSPGVHEMTWNRWLWKWKDKARLTDEEYDQLQAYARNFREAKRAQMAKDQAAAAVSQQPEKRPQ